MRHPASRSRAPKTDEGLRMTPWVNGPIPFFGIGAMRAGTSWLSDLLKRYPDCRIAPLKELHFFDSRHGVASGFNILVEKADKLALHATKIRSGLTESLRNELRETRRNDAPDAEEDAFPAQNDRTREADAHLRQSDEFRQSLFERLDMDRRLKKISEIVDFFSVRDLSSYVLYLTRGTAGASAFGEITPSYALLPAHAFAEMDEAFPGARFIFILRDPIDRLWSHVRYVDSRKKRRRDKPDLDRAFRRALELPSFVARSSYSRTITTLESVIPSERILYLFYETMVSPDTGPGEIRRIESMLNLQPLNPGKGIFLTARNAAPESMLDPENRAAAFVALEAEYAFVADRFGLQEKWQQRA
jgi:hypothetical protein